MTNAFAVKVVLSTDFEYLGKNTEIYAYTCQHRATVRGGENREMDREPEYRHNGQIKEERLCGPFFLCLRMRVRNYPEL